MYKQNQVNIIVVFGLFALLVISCQRTREDRIEANRVKEAFNIDITSPRPTPDQREISIAGTWTGGTTFKSFENINIDEMPEKFMESISRTLHKEFPTTITLGEEAGSGRTATLDLGTMKLTGNADGDVKGLHMYFQKGISGDVKTGTASPAVRFQYDCYIEGAGNGNDEMHCLVTYSILTVKGEVGMVLKGNSDTGRK